MNQEDINEAMWNSLPEWQKEQLREEHAETNWPNNQKTGRRKGFRYYLSLGVTPFDSGIDHG